MPTVYEPQVILSIKDTPLGPNISADGEYAQIAARRTTASSSGRRVVPSPAHLGESQRRIELPGGRVRLPHLEEHRRNPRPAEAGQHLPRKSAPDSLALSRRRHAEVQDLRLVDRVLRDDIPDDCAALLRHEKRHTRPDAIAQVALGPGIGKHGPLDRRDLRHVSELGGTDLVRGVRGVPPI